MIIHEIAFEQTISEATDFLAFTGEGRDTAKKEFIPFEVYDIRGKANRDLGKPLKALLKTTEGTTNNDIAGASAFWQASGQPERNKGALFREQIYRARNFAGGPPGTPYAREK